MQKLKSSDEYRQETCRFAQTTDTKILSKFLYIQVKFEKSQNRNCVISFKLYAGNYLKNLKK